MENINEFLRSEEWRKFQESVGRRTFCISSDNFHASIIEHELPVVGKYFYVPRGPLIGNPKSEILNPKQILNSKFQIPNSFSKLIKLAKKNKTGWIRIDPASEEMLRNFQGLALKIQKAPHDMQPRELFIIDITKTEEQLLAEMKAKTRYNIKVAQKHEVSVRAISNESCHPELDSGSNKGFQLSQSVRFRVKPGMTNDHINKFIELVKITAKRDGITPHPEEYYRKMFEIIPGEVLKLYVAEYDGKIIAANIVIHYGDTAIYLHGASDNEFRNVMAPYLLQWQQIKDAKKTGLSRYDFGGVKTGSDSSWAGITKFKTGFSPSTLPVVFPGSYDIIINKKKYFIYRVIQKLKAII